MDQTSASHFLETFPFNGSLEDQISALTSAATRAPSTHNSQPWRFKIHGSKLRVYRDTRIALPQSDSVNRYAHVSIGFLLHHIVLLGTWLSMYPRLSPLLEGEFIAEIDFSSAIKSTEIPKRVSAVFTRRNRRGEFSSESIPSPILEEALHVPNAPFAFPEIKVVADKNLAARIAEASERVMLRVYQRPEFRREMSRWIAPTGSGRLTGLPGYSLNQPFFLSWILPTIIRFVNIGKIPATLTRAAIASAPAVFGFGAEDAPAGWVATGYAASHAALTLVAHGFDYSVFVAAIEYDDTRKLVGEAFGLSQPLEFLFAAGKLSGSATWMTPRVPLKDKMMP